MKNPVHETFAIKNILAFQKIDKVYIKQSDDCLAFKNDKLVTFAC